MAQPLVVPTFARSWVPVPSGSDFPIQNLPFGLASPKGRGEAVVVAIGDFALDLDLLANEGLLDAEEFPFLNSFLDLGLDEIRALRAAAFDLLREDNPALRDHKKLRTAALIPRDKANLQVPIQPNAFVDFYSGIHHAENVGRLVRPDQPPLLPNYRYLPVGYNGRASTVVASGTPIRRPKGQFLPAGAQVPVFEPTRELDFELELGCYLGEGTEPGRRITVAQAEPHILGLVLVNDWSARDLQRWEYQPLGPFLAKSFATSISPWIVTLDALEPFRMAGPPQEPEPFPHLRRQGDAHFSLVLEAWLQPAGAKQPTRITRSSMAYQYWSFPQMLAHQTSNGTVVEAGDLYASGTLSGPEPEAWASLLELTRRGTEPLKLDGVERTFLQDGDRVTLRAYAETDDLRIGFGEVTGEVLPAH